MRKLQLILSAGVFAGVATVALTAVVSSSRAQDASALPGGRVKIASNFVRADGCQDTSQAFTTQVPAADRLDRSYHGLLDGIEVVETAANNGHAYRNFTWANNGNSIAYELYAKGAGYWIDPPKVLGVKIGGGYCHGAAGASEGVEIYAHYRTP